MSPGPRWLAAKAATFSALSHSLTCSPLDIKLAKLYAVIHTVVQFVKVKVQGRHSRSLRATMLHLTCVAEQVSKVGCGLLPAAKHRITLKSTNKIEVRSWGCLKCCQSTPHVLSQQMVHSKMSENIIIAACWCSDIEPCVGSCINQPQNDFTSFKYLWTFSMRGLCSGSCKQQHLSNWSASGGQSAGIAQGLFPTSFMSRRLYLSLH